MALRVMLISAADHVSGPAKGIFQLIENLDRAEVDIRLFTFQYNDIKETLFRNAAKDKNIPLQILFQRNRSYLSLVRQTLRAIREGGYDLVQTHGFKPTFLGFFARLFGGVRWVCFMHGTTSENPKVAFYNFIDNLLQRAAHRTVIVSEAQRTRIWGGSDRERVVVLHNAVDVSNPLPRSEGPPGLRFRLGLSPNSRLLVTMGRFSPEKGMDLLIESFSLLGKNSEDTHLILVGDGQERPSLQSRVRDLNLDSRVHFVGFTQTPGDYLAEADLFVLPSRSEGIPNAILEAMAIEVPVVATAVGGVPEIIEDGVSGALVPPEDPAALAQALARLLGDPQEVGHLKAQAKARVRAAFSVQARTAGLLAIYKGIQ